MNMMPTRSNPGDNIRLTRYSSWQVLLKYRRNTIEKSQVCLALLPAVAFAQDRIKYVYDAAGNRVRREAAVSVQKAMTRRQTVVSEEKTQPDMLRERSIKIGPNPTDCLLRISISGIGENDKCSLDVYTPLGALILTKQVVNGVAEIDISSCSAGVYLIKITVNNSQTTWKIVKK